STRTVASAVEVDNTRVVPCPAQDGAATRTQLPPQRLCRRRSQVVRSPRRRGLAVGYRSLREAVRVVAQPPKQQIAGEAKEAADPTGDVFVVDVGAPNLLQQRLETDGACGALDLEETPVRSFGQSVFIS